MGPRWSSCPGLPLVLADVGLLPLWSSGPCLVTPFWSELPGFPGDLLAGLPVLLLVLGWLVDGLPPLSSVLPCLNLFSGLASLWLNRFVTEILLSDTVTSRGDAALCCPCLLPGLCCSSSYSTGIWISTAIARNHKTLFPWMRVFGRKWSMALWSLMRSWRSTSPSCRI